MHRRFKCFFFYSHTPRTQYVWIIVQVTFKSGKRISLKNVRQFLKLCRISIKLDIVMKHIIIIVIIDIINRHHFSGRLACGIDFKIHNVVLLQFNFKRFGTNLLCFNVAIIINQWFFINLEPTIVRNV